MIAGHRVASGRRCFSRRLSHKLVSSGRFKTILGMAQNFLACDREQLLLLPPSLHEWLPGGRLWRGS
jgi:hypothetical protein